MRAWVAAWLIVQLMLAAGCLGDGTSRAPAVGVEGEGCLGTGDHQPDTECIDDGGGAGTGSNGTDGAGNGSSDKGYGGGKNGTTSSSPQARGVAAGERLPDVHAAVRTPGGPDWVSTNLSSWFDTAWNGSAEPVPGASHPYTLFVFVSTDCPHCWNAADDLGEWAARHQGQLRLAAIAVNFFGNDAFNATREEVAAFQDRTPHPGCQGDTADCSTRPGAAHPFPYADDRNQTLMRAWNVSSVPSAILVQPNGTVAWNERLDGGKTAEVLDTALRPPLGTRAGARIVDIVSLGRTVNGSWTELDLNLWWRAQAHAEGDHPGWLLIEVASTDCTNCWNHGPTLEGWQERWSDELVIVTLTDTWNDERNDTVELAEIAAYQDRVSAATSCRVNRDCAARPGSPHDWLYVADLDEQAGTALGISGQPRHLLVDAWGVIRWTQMDAQGLTPQQAIEQFLDA